MRKKILMFAVFTFLGTTTLLAMGRRLEGALNPTLLWEKEFPGRILVGNGVQLAKSSGDVIVNAKADIEGASDSVFLFDKTGNLIHQWENRGGGRISDDGETVITLSSPPGFDFYNKVRYSTRDGQEIWNQMFGGIVYLSPDGEMVIDASGEEDSTGVIEVFNSNGEKTWGYKVGEDIDIDVRFSPNSDFIAVSRGQGKVRLYTKDGILLWTRQGYGTITSISEGASYVSLLGGSKEWPPYEGSSLPTIYDKDGKVISNDVAKVSGDGKISVAFYNDKTTIMNLPDLAIIHDYPFEILELYTEPTSSTNYGGSSAISYDGRYVALIGRRIESPVSEIKLFVIDTVADDIWEASIVSAGKSEVHWRQVFLTQDGKYMLIQAVGKLYYYQIY